MRDIIKSDNKYQQLGDLFSYNIKSYANDYELLTFHYLKYNYRKFIESYNLQNTKSERKAFPIPIGLNFTYLGLAEIYLIDLQKKLPRNSNIGLVKIIGPGEISKNSLYLYTDIENYLNNLGYKTYTIFYYYSWGSSNKYNKIISPIPNLNYDILNHNKNTNKLKNKNKITKKDIVFCNQFSLKKRINAENESKSLPFRLKFINISLNMLKKYGDLYLEYFNCSKVETLLLMISLEECFEKYYFIRSNLRKDTLSGGYYVFKNFNGKKLNNLIYKNILNFEDISKLKKNFFVKFINKTQKKIYRNYSYFLRKCKLISESKKSKKYFEDYQISLGIDWCNNNDVMISDYYKYKLYNEKDVSLLKKIFYPERNIDYKKLDIYYDSFYSVTLFEDYLKIKKIIKKYFPNEKKIIDACSNVGASTISFSYDFDKVVGVEIDINRFKMLENNVNVYKRKNIELINKDFIDLSQKFKNDLIFFDPPWEGIYYKLKNKIELYLGNKNIKKILNNKYIIKAPSNFNYSDMKNIYVEKLKNFLLIIKNKVNNNKDDRIADKMDKVY